MVNSLDNAERICDKESLQFQLSFMALFIGMFEFMKDTLISRVESFLCSNMTQNEDGEWVYIHNGIYSVAPVDKRRIVQNGEKSAHLKGQTNDECGKLSAF